jgi:methanethiol oxidase
MNVGSNGAARLAPDFFVDFGDLRSHQVRLQGGDASSDFYCYP